MRPRAPRFAAFILIVWAVAPATANDLAMKTFEAERCGLCHAVSAIGVDATAKSAKMHGPDLSGFVADDVPRMIAYLRQEETPEGMARHRRKAKAPDDEMIALLDWLASLERPEDPDGEPEGSDGEPDRR